MFDAAYWHAPRRAGWPAILALPPMSAQRVHLAIETGRGYRRDQNGSASVTLTTAGGAITREQAAALKYLVSSGVRFVSLIAASGHRQQERHRGQQ